MGQPVETWTDLVQILYIPEPLKREWPQPAGMKRLEEDQISRRAMLELAGMWSEAAFLSAPTHRQLTAADDGITHASRVLYKRKYAVSGTI